VSVAPLPILRQPPHWGASPVAGLAAVWYHRGRSASRSAITMPSPATPTYLHAEQEEEEAPTPAEVAI